MYRVRMVLSKDLEGKNKWNGIWKCKYMYMFIEISSRKSRLISQKVLYSKMHRTNLICQTKVLRIVFTKRTLHVLGTLGRIPLNDSDLPPQPKPCAFHQFSSSTILTLYRLNLNIVPSSSQLSTSLISLFRSPSFVCASFGMYAEFCHQI